MGAASEPEASIGGEVETLQARFQSLSSEFETMLVAGERDRFERLYRELRATVNGGDLLTNWRGWPSPTTCSASLGLSMAAR